MDWMQVIRLVFLNMFLCMAWSLSVINPENVDEGLCTDLVSKQAAFMEHLQVCIDSLLDSWEQGNARSILTCTVGLLSFSKLEFCVLVLFCKHVKISSILDCMM
jgi:hypothetical protein